MPGVSSARSRMLEFRVLRVVSAWRCGGYGDPSPSKSTSILTGHDFEVKPDVMGGDSLWHKVGFGLGRSEILHPWWPSGALLLFVVVLLRVPF